MKKMISFLLATVIIFSLCLMPAYADDESGFEVRPIEVFVYDGEEYIPVSWSEVAGADHYSLLIESNDRFSLFVEDIEECSYNWVADIYSTGVDIEFWATVYAYDKDNTLIGEGVTENFRVDVAMWDYWGLYGDVDTDNDVTVLDSTLIQQYLVGEHDLVSYRYHIADVNIDGVVTVFDATYIQFFCALIYIEDNMTYREFWRGGSMYMITMLDPVDPPVDTPTVEVPTEPVPTDAPTEPEPPYAA